MQTDDLPHSIMLCYQSLSNILPSPLEEQIKIDRQAIFAELVCRYAEVVDRGFLDGGCDAFANQILEFFGIIASSHARLIVEIAGESISRIAGLVSDEAVPFHKFDPSLPSEVFDRLKSIPSIEIAKAATLQGLTRDSLENIMMRFLAECEIIKQQSPLPPLASAVGGELVSRKDLLEFYGIKSNTLCDRINLHGHPKPVTRGGRGHWFVVADCDKWLSERKNK